MNINNFEESIDSTILKRGYDYFQNEHVDNLEKIAPGLWMAQVHGSETYTVTVNTKNTQIKGWECNCPYDYGDVCKHVTATLYAIAQNKEVEKSQSKMKIANKKQNRTAEIFKKASKEDLAKFLIAQFAKNSKLRNQFVAYFADLLDEDIGRKYHTVVNCLYKSAQGNHGFIDYHSTGELCNPMADLLKKAENFVADGNVIESLSICKAIIENVPVFIHNMDDSNGEAGSLIGYSFDVFEQIIEQVPPMLKDELFDYCIEEYPKGKYHDFEIEYNFLDILPILTTTPEQESKLFGLIDSQIETEKIKSFSEYSVVQLLKAKIFYLEANNKIDEARKIIEQHIQYPDFREMLLNEATENKNYEKAKSLCKRGIIIAENERHSGTVIQWKEKLLEISEKEKNISDILKWSETLFFENHFSMEFYRKLRSVYNQKEWPDKCEEIINKIKGVDQMGNHTHLITLANIFVEEKYISRLLKLVQLNPTHIHFVNKYSKHLTNEYPDEMIAVYEKGINEYAKQTGRSFYNEIAKLLKKMQKIKGGDKKVTEMINLFRVKYKARKAMMEVLNFTFPGTIVKTNKPNQSTDLFLMRKILK